MRVVRTLERVPRAVGLRTHQTSVAPAPVDTHPVQGPKGVSGVLPAGSVEARGSPTAVHLALVTVAIEVGTGEEVQDTGVVDNTEVPEAVGAS